MGNKDQTAATGVHEESHMGGTRAVSLPVSLARIILPWPQFGQTVESTPVRARSMSCQVWGSPGVSCSRFLGAARAPGAWRLRRARAFSSLVLALAGGRGAGCGVFSHRGGR